MIHIQVKATNLTLTSDISEYLEKKINSLERFIDPEDTSAKAIVEIKKTTNHHKDGEDLFMAEVNFHVGKTHLYAKNSNQVLFAAIDEVKDELHRELTTQKRKAVHMVRRGGQVIKNILKGFSKK